MRDTGLRDTRRGNCLAVSCLAVSRLLVLLGACSYIFELQNYGGCRRRLVNKSAFKCHFSVQNRLFLVKNT